MLSCTLFIIGVIAGGFVDYLIGADVTVKNTNIQFVAPASNGKKSADIKRCQLLYSSLNRGWSLKECTPAFTPA